ncbi:ArsR family transcriptional regulator [Methanocaldococcus vulcanius M7]|uniref:ArsR family transcriptional regulator n=1 Tax=Methanocaldococcus vulcanius (strain ATCC 700851 / DSM 12094 / M7) TaxID=579137 RepID=C9RHS1_METVM|nr:ArsR family transcriptional regulator [Methanocaldococcus vulcanius]ACX73123.1 ArsR family transcriptional regulator [Methanocaldococcus vulcanius M7]
MFSKTKIEILKKLNERNYTTSELSKILGKSKINDK